MSSLQHHNIVFLRKYFADENFVYIMTDPCLNLTLANLISKRKRLTEFEVKYYTLRIAEAIQNLHISNVIHRNITMENVLIDKHMGV